MMTATVYQDKSGCQYHISETYFEFVRKKGDTTGIPSYFQTALQQLLNVQSLCFEPPTRIRLAYVLFNSIFTIQYGIIYL